MSRFPQNFVRVFRKNQVFYRWKIKYSLPLVTSWERHISASVNYEFYCWRQFTWLAVSSRLTDSGQVVIHAVTQCAYSYRHKKIIEYLALSQEDKLPKQFTMKNCTTHWHILGSINTVINRCVLTFHQMFVSTVKPIIYKHRSMTSSWRPRGKKYLTFYKWNTCFLFNISWKFRKIRNIFHRNIKENVNGCFF